MNDHNISRGVNGPVQKSRAPVEANKECLFVCAFCYDARRTPDRWAPGALAAHQVAQHCRRHALRVRVADARRRLGNGDRQRRVPAAASPRLRAPTGKVQSSLFLTLPPPYNSSRKIYKIACVSSERDIPTLFRTFLSYSLGEKCTFACFERS